MDLNEDGNLDILSGSYSRMSQEMAGLFQVLWGQPNGEFQAAAELTGTEKEPLIIPADKDTITECICTRPMAVDWDGDQDLDLVVGNFSGTFYLFTGEGKGKFAPKPRQLMADNGPLRIAGAHSDPFPIDWDGDGDLDLLSGSSAGGVQWAENSAGSSQPPKFTKFQDLIPPGRQIPFGEKISESNLAGPASSTRVWADDVNGDGKSDLLVGDSVALVSAAKGTSEEEFEQKLKQWQKNAEKLNSEYQSAGQDPKRVQELSQKIQQLYGERTKFMVEDRTGFVWLYVQK